MSVARHSLRAVTEPAHLTATRSGYDAIAESCAGPFRAALDDAPLDRALLAAFAEMVRRDHPDLGRVLRPGGHVLLAFQVGDDTLHVDEAFGHEVSLDFHRLDPDAVVTTLEAAGFELVARLVRAPEVRHTAAPVPQGFLIGRKPA